jgi:hypothetical protein
MAAADYTTVARVKDLVGVTDAGADAPMAEIITGVSRLFDQLVGVPFYQLLAVEYHDGWSYRNGITLNAIPSEDITDRGAVTVKEDGVALTIADDFVLDDYPSAMLWRVKDGVFSARWATGERNIQVTYATRFKEIPEDVARAATEESARAYQNRNVDNVESNRIGITQRTPESGTGVSYDVDALSATTTSMLNAYRQNRFI